MSSELDAVAAARKLLEESGFRVSEKPISWNEFSAIVSIKVQSPDFNESKLVRDLEECLAPHYEARSKIAERTNTDIRAFTGPVVKRYSRVVARGGSSDV